MKNKTYIAIGYSVTDETITRNGLVENYGERETRDQAIDACLYTHRVHNKKCIVSKNGIVVCPKHGQFAIIGESQNK